jgi:hypothetical protein
MAIIDKPSDYFNTVLYTGNGSTQSITGVGFQPDLTWIKNRTDTYGHRVVNSVTDTVMFTNSTAAEETDSNVISSFDSNGFSIGTDAGTNANTNAFASWNWLASNTTASNTDGSISSTVSANTTSGFSIVSYDGTGANATVGHGLGVAPSMIITKPRSNVYGWLVYHKSNGATQYMVLNETAAVASGSTNYQDTTPTSSVVSIGTNSGINPSSSDMIMYCFAEKQGYSKFGSYTGNGNADGTFVYTGFKSAMVIYKKTSGTENWFIHDNKRQGFNPENELLFPDLNNAEGTVNRIDLLSNGFKATTSDGGINGSGATYIYACFASNPFVTSTGVPATAR